MNLRELRDLLKNSPTLQKCEDPERTYSILNKDGEFGNKDVLYIFSEDLNQNICVHVYDSKKDVRGNVRITYIH